MKFMRLLKNDFYRAFSPIFIYSVLFVLALRFLSSSFEIQMVLQYGEPNISLIYLFGLGGTGFGEMFAIAAVLPSLTLYYQDLKSRNIVYSISRSSKNSYLISKAVVSFVSGFLAVFTAYILYIIFCLNIMPLIDENSVYLLEMNYVATPWQFIFEKVLSFSLGGGFYAVTCLIISNISSSVFIIAVSPYILIRLINDLNDFINLPYHFIPSSLIFSYGIETSFDVRILYKIAYFLILSTLCAIIYIFQSKRKEV